MGNREKNFISAVIYVHNAEDKIAAFLKKIAAVLEENFEHSEIICVNDGSEDGSLSAIKAVAGDIKKSSVSVINMSNYHGIELAMNAGVDLAIGDFVFEFDHTVADYDSAEIMNVYYRALQGFDIVSAAPNKKERISSKLFYKLIDRFGETRYQMHTESFRILSRRVINRITSMNKTVPYRKVIYASAGLKMDTLIYQATNTSVKAGDRKEREYRANLAIDSLILFTQIGYRFSIAMTGLMMLITLFMMVYSIVIYAAMHPVPGWTTTILFFSVAFCGLFGVMTIVIKYLQILVNLVFKRKQYSFESIEKLTK